MFSTLLDVFSWLLKAFSTLQNAISCVLNVISDGKETPPACLGIGFSGDLRVQILG